jgi:hypothetical protein
MTFGSVLRDTGVPRVVARVGTSLHLERGTSWVGELSGVAGAG